MVIEAHALTQRFGSFTAVDHVNFQIERGEIYGFLGANGCGKSTTMKMLCGLLPPTEGQAWLFGEPVDANDIDVRRKVGYMSQAFSLYSELTVRQNLVLHAQLFDVPRAEIPQRVEETAARFGLGEIMEALPDSLPLGQRQRLQLAVALIHRPDPAHPRRADLGGGPGGPGRVLGAPDRPVPPRQGHHLRVHALHQRGRALRPHLADERRKGAGHRHAGRGGQGAARGDAGRGLHRLPGRGGGEKKGRGAGAGGASHAGRGGLRASKSDHGPASTGSWFSLQRMLACSYRELVELTRDPIRMTMAGLGTVLLMFIMGYGISLDVEHLKYAVLDRDQTTVSRDYLINIAGSSRYFTERPPVADYDELDRRMRSGELSMVIEIPPASAATWSGG